MPLMLTLRVSRGAACGLIFKNVPGFSAERPHTAVGHTGNECSAQRRVDVNYALQCGACPVVRISEREFDVCGKLSFDGEGEAQVAGGCRSSDLTRRVCGCAKASNKSTEGTTGNKSRTSGVVTRKLCWFMPLNRFACSVMSSETRL